MSWFSIQELSKIGKPDKLVNVTLTKDEYAIVLNILKERFKSIDVFDNYEQDHRLEYLHKTIAQSTDQINAIEKHKKENKKLENLYEKLASIADGDKNG